MTRRALGAALALGLACVQAGNSGAKRGAAADAALEIELEGPLLLGFFPALRTEPDGGPVTEAFYHLGAALYATRECLAQSDVRVDEVQGEQISIADGARRHRIDLRGDRGDGLGCFLVAPGREPELVRGTGDPSALQLGCPAAAARYFAVPECCPQGERCAP